MRALFVSVIMSLLAAAASASTPAATKWPQDRLDALIAAAEAAPEHGLPRSSERIDAVTAARGSGDVDAAADALLMELVCARARGWSDPARVDPEWKIPRPKAPDFSAVRETALAGPGVDSALDGLAPRDPRYAALVAELARLRADPATDPARLDKVRAALERWRWLPRRVPDDRIEVNVPGFALTLYEAGAPARRHEVIVGQPDRQTPALVDRVVALKLNPDWTVPRSIAQRSLIPELRKSPRAVAARGYQAVAPGGKVLPVTRVPWRRLPADGAPYYLRQRPGPNNSLGQIKLEMTNDEAIYLHGTPAKNLFDETARAFSSGCVRVKDLDQLAVSLLERAREWDETRMRQTLATDDVTLAELADPIPTWLVYFTAAPDETGQVIYHDDVYGRDGPLLQALSGPPTCAE